LKIDSMDLNGTIPSTLGALANLTTIWLSGNSLTGTIPSEFGNLANLEAVYFSYNSATGTLPSELGLLKNLTYLNLGDNMLTGAIPSELGLLTNLDSLYLGDNMLTGSIPIELLNENFTNSFSIEGNNLTLTAVDGKEICVVGGTDVYCHCSTDCMNSWSGQCDCEEAKLCCSAYMEQFTECDVCSSSELENPDTVDEWGWSCQKNSDFFKDNLNDYGTEEGCDFAKGYFEELGCFCSEVEQIEPQSTSNECVLCPSGAIENPDTYLELHSASCQEMSNYVLNDLILYGTEEVCDEAKLWFEGVGCFCSTGGD